MSKNDDEQYSEAETIKRREAALQRMMKTPHMPHKPLGTKKKTKAKKKPKP